MGGCELRLIHYGRGKSSGSGFRTIEQFTADTIGVTQVWVLPAYKEVINKIARYGSIVYPGSLPLRKIRLKYMIDYVIDSTAVCHGLYDK